VLAGQWLGGMGRIEPLPAGPGPRPGVTTEPALPAPRTGPVTTHPATFQGAVVCQRIPLDPWKTYVIMRQRDGRFALGRTFDAGRTWTGGVLPDDLQTRTYTDGKPPCTGIDPQALATYPTVVDGQTIFLGTMVTRDGGATWAVAAHGAADPLPGGNPAGAPVRAAIGPPVADVPRGWPLRGSFALKAFYAVDPATNVHHPWSRAAGLTDPPAVTPDGTMWASFDSGTHKNTYPAGEAPVPDVYYDVVGVSTDSGRTWERHPVPESAGAFTRLVPVDRHTAYALGEKAVLITHDGGRTWSQVPVPPGYGFLDPVVRHDGSLLVTVTSPTGKFQPYLAVTTDGREFSPISGADGLSLCPGGCGAEPYSGRATTANGAYLAMRVDPKGGEVVHKYVSMDGLDWTAVPTPPGARLGAQS
jgi:hypothetical protein